MKVILLSVSTKVINLQFAVSTCLQRFVCDKYYALHVSLDNLSDLLQFEAICLDSLQSSDSGPRTGNVVAKHSALFHCFRSSISLNSLPVAHILIYLLIQCVLFSHTNFWHYTTHFYIHLHPEFHQ